MVSSTNLVLFKHRRIEITKMNSSPIVKPKWFKEPQDLSSSLNKEVTLECDVISYPFPVVKWFKLDKNGK